MTKKILIEYCETNEKWDLTVDDVWCGKHYTLQEAIKGIDRAILLVEREKMWEAAWNKRKIYKD